ncbi:MAG: hypothetical protein AAGK98_19640 [Pseudomonadota bacterium]
MAELERLWLDEGRIRAELRADLPPQVELLLDLVPFATPPVRLNDRSRFECEAPLPVEALSDGVSTVVLRELGTENPLGRLPIAAGAVVEADVSGELAVLRAELDLLKRVVRQIGRGRTF